MRLKAMAAILCLNVILSPHVWAMLQTEVPPHSERVTEGQDESGGAASIEQIEVKGTALEKLSTSVQQYQLALELGLSALHSKNYEDALRLLQASAKQGNKLSQFYLAQMYFEGLGTPINNELGWAWLNVALEQKIPEWTFAYQQISKVIPEEIKHRWAPTVEQYIANYGAEATNHKCRPVKATGSNIATVMCNRVHDGTYEFAQWRTIQELFFNP